MKHKPFKFIRTGAYTGCQQHNIADYEVLENLSHTIIAILNRLYDIPEYYTFPDSTLVVGTPRKGGKMRMLNMLRKASCRHVDSQGHATLQDIPIDLVSDDDIWATGFYDEVLDQTPHTPYKQCHLCNKIVNISEVTDNDVTAVLESLYVWQLSEQVSLEDFKMIISIMDRLIDRLKIIWGYKTVTANNIELGLNVSSVLHGNLQFRLMLMYNTWKKTIANQPEQPINPLEAWPDASLSVYGRFNLTPADLQFEYKFTDLEHSAPVPNAHIKNPYDCSDCSGNCGCDHHSTIDTSHQHDDKCMAIMGGLHTEALAGDSEVDPNQIGEDQPDPEKHKKFAGAFVRSPLMGRYGNKGVIAEIAED